MSYLRRLVLIVWILFCKLFCKSFSQVTTTQQPWSSNYHQIPNIRHTKSQNLNVSHLVRCYLENEDIIGAVPTGEVPTTSEWSTILLPTMVHVILEVWQCLWMKNGVYLQWRLIVYMMCPMKYVRRMCMHIISPVYMCGIWIIKSGPQRDWCFAWLLWTTL